MWAWQEAMPANPEPCTLDERTVAARRYGVLLHCILMCVAYCQCAVATVTAEVTGDQLTHHVETVCTTGCNVDMTIASRVVLMVWATMIAKAFMPDLAPIVRVVIHITSKSHIPLPDHTCKVAKPREIPSSKKKGAEDAFAYSVGKQGNDKGRTTTHSTTTLQTL
ncbi:hypothetical protein BC834DRAFT_845597 [Gloeopeniophorella convolvens]|nr:hypothetical protein BC834DRAFT_845597 [Gloeopeniophorella convolvens]